MSRIFICCHCQKYCRKNPRIKVGQEYCGVRSCQQARKNSWERGKRSIDREYKSKRQASQRRWYSQNKGSKYHSDYRKIHPGYIEDNRKKQTCRNEKRRCAVDCPKIVKTDALALQSLDLQGIYALVPFEKLGKETDASKIVKTDALFVQLTYIQGYMNILRGNMSNSS